MFYNYLFTIITSFFVPLATLCGPYIFIFNLCLLYLCIYLYYLDYIPPTDYKYIQINGFNISNKIILLLLTIILLLNYHLYSVWYGFGSFCYIYIYMRYHLYEKRLPKIIESFGKSYLVPLFKSFDNTNRRIQYHEPRRQQQQPQQYYQQPALDRDLSVQELERLFAQNELTEQSGTGMVHASEENINSLLMLGFTREECITALERCNNDVDRAANELLGSN